MTKGELASRVLKLIGVNTRTSEADPEEVQDTIAYMEDWMLANAGIGKRIGYNAASGVPSAEDDSGVPDWSVMGITNSVAIYIAPYFEKNVHPSIMANAAKGMMVIESKTVELLPVQYPSRMPRGQANSGPYGRKCYKPSTRIQTENDFLKDEGGEAITND
jgi:hypothetical protein